MMSYVAPKVGVRHVAEWRSTPNVDDVCRILLGSETGELTAEVVRQPYVWGGPVYEPDRDLWIRGWYWDRTPRWIAWAMPYPQTQGWATGSAETVNAHLDRIAPTAQALLDALVPVPGTSREWEWTARAAAAHQRITDTVTRHATWWRLDSPLPDRGESAIDFGDVVAAVPDVTDPGWAGMDDAALDEVAAWLTTWYPGHATSKAIWDRYDGGGGTGNPVYITAARTGLRAWRDEAVAARTGLPARPADHALTGSVLVDGVTPDLDDDGLHALAARIDATVAHTDRVALTGTVGYLRDQRDQQRRRIRQQIGTTGDLVAEAEKRLGGLRATRTGLIAQALGWGEPPEWRNGQPDYAGIAGIARMTRQSARELVHRILLVDDE